MSIVSDTEEDSLAQPPAVGSRRVSTRLAACIVLGCGVLGVIIGVLRPLHSPLPNPHGVEAPGDLKLASARVGDAPAAIQPGLSTSHTDQSEAAAASNAPSTIALSATAPVSTGSVDRASSSAPSESAVLISPQRQAPVRSEHITAPISRSHHVARAKRLRRILWRQVRVKPAGAQIEAFFSSLAPKN